MVPPRAKMARMAKKRLRGDGFGRVGGADFFLYQPYRAYPKDLRYSLGLIHPRERFRRCSQ